jgi:hypothetical protein
MGQSPLILRSLENFIELAKPFLPKAFGGQGKSLFSDTARIIDIKESITPKNPLTMWVGENPLIFLDCGAVIDFEKYFYDNSLGVCGKDKPRDCSKYLETLSYTGRVIIPDYMKMELENHRNCQINNGRKEISDKTFDSINRISADSSKIIKHLKPSLERDKIGLDVYWATKECFKDNHKKDLCDRISRNDRDLVVDAIHAKNSKIEGKEITSTLIFSPDYHVLQLVHFLKNPDYNYQGIFAFPSRSGKDGRYDIH